MVQYIVTLVEKNYNMDVKVKTDYRVLETIIKDKGYEDYAEGLVDNFLYVYEGDVYTSEEELKSVFQDYLMDVVDLPCGENEELFDIDSIKIEILNWEEILPELSHMIVI